MAITHTDRGGDGESWGANNLVSGTFTPAADALLISLLYHDYESSNGVTSIAGHDGGGSWAKIYGPARTGANGRYFELWGAFTGSSPSSGTVSITIPYQFGKAVQWIEFSGVDVSGTVANAFGASDAEGGYNVTAPALDLGTLDSSESYVFCANGKGATGETATVAEGGWTEIVGTTPYMVEVFLKENDATCAMAVGSWQNLEQLGYEIKVASAGPSSCVPCVLMNMGEL